MAPSPPITGRCHCGAVKYTVTGPPGFAFFCACADCRVLNGGGHLAGLGVPLAELTVEGEPQVYRYPGGSGSVVEARFCGTCGTPLLAVPEHYDGMAVLRCNSLDDPTVYRPRKVLHGEAAFPWDTLP